MAVVDFDQTRFPNDLAQMVDLVANVAPPGSRVLEIGCGDGAITRALAARGFDVLGVDPNAPEGEHTRAIRLEDVDLGSDAPFDAVFASVSLHHLAGPKEATSALRRLTKPGSVIVVREFDKELGQDPATLEWTYYQRRAQALFAPAPSTTHTDGHGHEGHAHEEHAREGHGHEEHAHERHGQHHELPDTFAEFRDRWIAMMDSHVLPWETVRSVITNAGFAETSFERCAYLYRWELHEALRPLEEALGAAGLIKQIGILWQGSRTD